MRKQCLLDMRYMAWLAGPRLWEVSVDSVDAHEASARRSKIWSRTLLVVILVGVVLLPISWMVYGWTSRMILLNKMLYADSYSLKYDPATRSRVEAILPQLIEIHREAVAECGDSKMSDLSKMDAFNRRISSWHAILTAMHLTRDPSSLSYVQGFVESDQALPEEVTTGEETIEQVWGKRPDTKASRVRSSAAQTHRTMFGEDEHEQPFDTWHAMNPNPRFSTTIATTR